MSSWTADELNEKLLQLDINGHISNGKVVINHFHFYKPGGVSYESKHSYSEFHYLIKGRNILSVDNECIAMSDGMIAYIPPRTKHSTISNLPRNENYIKCTISFDLNSDFTPHEKFNVEELKLLRRLGDDRGYWIGPDSSGCFNQLDNIIRELLQSRIGYYSVIENMLGNLIIFSIRSKNHLTVADYSIPTRAHEDYFHLAKYYIENNYRNNISRKDMSTVFCCSPRHADRLLYESCGKSFRSMLNKFRLEKAKDFLTETNLSIEKIAEETGFGSSSQLSQLFKKEVGIVPSEYRKLKTRIDSMPRASEVQ